MSDEYLDAHMTDEDGVRWVKVEYANSLMNESSRSPGCSTAIVEQMREALEMVKGYFWEPLYDDQPAWTEGEVQEFVEAAIKASR